MAKLFYQDKQYHCRDGETVLQAFMRQGVTVPFSCGNGVCHVCLQRCENGLIPAAAQKGLRKSLVDLGYFLVCKCFPEGDMHISQPRAADLFNRAVVYKKELLAPDVCRLLLEPATQLYYHAGQFINIRGENNVTRSYSLASVPHQDYFLELHIKRVRGGVFSNWIFDSLHENDELEFQGPLGGCHYIPGEQEKPLLLLGTGTGLSPLLGIARDALTSGHSAPIYLYHGSTLAEGLYLRSTLQELAAEYENFHFSLCVSGEDVPASGQMRQGRVNELAFVDHRNLKGWRVYLCGHPGMVNDAKTAALRGGASELEIYADSFWMQSGGTVGVPDDNDVASGLQKIERRKYPEPDHELWQGLEEGQLLSLALEDFYTRAFGDELLAPYFHGVTRQRAIEKQYNFLFQAITGKNVYFGERPRNAHHWMVISDELFDYREDLLAESLRRYKVPEQFIRRLRTVNELYRSDIVKDKPWKKILFGQEVPVEGFDEITLDDATLCDSCQQEIAAGSKVQYHVRIGKVYCAQCQNAPLGQ